METSGRADDLVQLAVAPNEVVAALWRGVLEDAGIPVLVKVLGLGHAYWSTFAAAHALYVRRRDSDRARELLEALDLEP